MLASVLWAETAKVDKLIAIRIFGRPPEVAGALSPEQVTPARAHHGIIQSSATAGAHFAQTWP